MATGLETEVTCCFTGHRPDKLPWGTREEDPRCAALREQLSRHVEGLYRRGYRHFITGMARGADLLFAQAVLDLREKYGDLTLEAAVPCEGQADRWPAGERAQYQAILDQCDYETLVQRRYDRGCMHRRDRYMVDRASAVLAVYSGSPGGTMYTLSYAMDRGLELIILDPEEL